MTGIFERLRNIREAEGWTQADIARMTGRVRSQIANAELGRGGSLTLAEKYAEALGYQVCICRGAVS